MYISSVTTLPLSHQDLPASPKAKPMAGRHKEIKLDIFMVTAQVQRSGVHGSSLP